MKYIKYYTENWKLQNEFVIEDTSATGGAAGASLGGSISSGGVALGSAITPGMGDVVSPQPSAIPGATIGPGWSDFGGTMGSGDIGSPYNTGPKRTWLKEKDNRPHSRKKSKKINPKFLKNHFSRVQDFTLGQGGSKSNRVMNFDDFQKSNLSKITIVKQ